MYLKSNGDCELPCWWGIEPGKTSEKEIHEKLGALGNTSTREINESTKSYSFSIEVPIELDRFGFFEPKFLIREGQVIAIKVGANYVSADLGLDFVGLLHHLGKPEEIWLTIYPYSVSGQPHYDMDLYFPNKGAMVITSGLAEVTEDRIQICPQGETLLPPGLLLLKPGEVTVFERLRLPPYNSMTGLDPYDSGLKPLDAYETDLTIEDFYSTYSDPANTQCFQIQLPDP